MHYSHELSLFKVSLGPVDKIIRKGKVNKIDFEYLVRWKGTDDDGNAWPDSWEPEKNITADVVEKFTEHLGNVTSVLVTVDAAPLLERARSAIDRAVALVKTR
jgi:hypothetical protein